MTWVLANDGRIVEWEGNAELGDSVSTADSRGGVVVGAGGARGAATEFAGNYAEIHAMAGNLVRKGSRLSRGDAAKSFEHFKDHRDLVQKALDSRYTVDTAGESAFLADISKHVASGQLRLIGAATLAKGEPVVYCFRGKVGNAQLTLFMKPSGAWQTIVRTGEGLDLKAVFLLRFDTVDPFMFQGKALNSEGLKRVALAKLDELRDNLKRNLEAMRVDHASQIDLVNKSLAGFAVTKAFNPNLPQIGIWNNAHGALVAAQTSLGRHDVIKATEDLFIARQEYLKALQAYLLWKDGIDGAGAKMQVAIGVVAVAIILAAVVAYAVPVVVEAGAVATEAEQGAEVAEKIFTRVAHANEQVEIHYRVAEAREVVTRGAEEELTSALKQMVLRVPK